jgi:D-methionine transport system permease protein
MPGLLPGSRHGHAVANFFRGLLGTAPLTDLEDIGFTPPWQVVSKVYLPEALPALLRAATLMAITLIGFSAMAGAIGAGGLGDFAIRYGYQRFRPGVTLCTVAVLVMLVQTIQFAGDALARRFRH